MPPKIKPKNGASSIKKVGEVRRSQVVSTYGCGAIVDFPRLSGIMAGIDYWNVSDGRLPDDAQFQERNLQKMLGKDFFVQISTDENAEKKFSIPVYRFPSYYYCPECHELDLYTRLKKPDNSNSEYNRPLYCSKCKTADGKPVALIPSRFIAACPNGHIDDFPYGWWVHRGTDTGCEKEQLFLEYRGNTGGLDSIIVRCKCGALKSMAGCMDKNALISCKCKGHMPWLGFNEDGKPWYKEPQNCNATMRTMQRSANNVYYPVTQSALTIPPWSSKIQKTLQRYDEALRAIFEMDDNPQLFESALKNHYEKRKDVYRCSFEQFRKEGFLKYKDGDTREITEEVLRADEYSAFCDEDRNEENDFFRTRSSEVPEELEDYIESIKVVSRLREVKVLKGFRRIDPIHESDPQTRAEKGIFDREFAPISRQPFNWLPAIQMFGEGILIQFKESAIAEWEEKNKERYSIMALRNQNSWIGNNMFDANRPRYILLHTVAHLLIRQFTAQCGYESASLREKIYSTFCGSDDKMCGILIYTSATDSDGSLGGLAREGDGYRLANTIFSMLENATWCSNDPICVDSKGQGFKSLNFAACHACGLLPETSCESANCLLDRAAVVGTPENREMGYFSNLL